MENKDKLSIRNWEPNALIYDYNTPSFNAYYIIEGQVDIFTPRGLKLNSIGPSEVFGEASLLLDKKRSVTARAGTRGGKNKISSQVIYYRFTKEFTYPFCAAAECSNATCRFK